MLLLRLLLRLLLLCVLLHCCCCCRCWLLFVVVHLPPRGLLFAQTAGVVLNDIFLITNEDTLVHPLTVHSLLCGLGFFTYTIPLMTITGIRGAAGGRQPAEANPPLYFVWWCRFKNGSMFFLLKKIPLFASRCMRSLDHAFGYCSVCHPTMSSVCASIAKMPQETESEDA